MERTDNSGKDYLELQLDWEDFDLLNRGKQDGLQAKYTYIIWILLAKTILVKGRVLLERKKVLFGVEKKEI